MKKRLSWRTASNRYAPLLSLEEAGDSSVILTTIKDLQNSGMIQIYGEDGTGRRELLTSLRLRNLPRNHPGDPVVTLRGSFDGKARVFLRAETGGSLRCSETVKLPRFLRSGGSRVLLPALLILAAVLAAGAAAWILLGRGAGDAAAGDARPTSVREASRQEAPASTATTGGTGRSGSTASTAGSGSSSAAGTVAGTAGAQAVPVPPETAPGTAGNAPAESRETPGAAREENSGTGSAGPAENTAPAAGDGAPGREQPVTAPAQAAPEAVLPVEPVIILFNPEEAGLLPAARTALDRLAETLKGRDLSKLTISGHCALFGSETERQELSLKRAEAAAAYLRSRGLNLPPAVRITGEGGTRPLTSDPARQDINRRVEIRL